MEAKGCSDNGVRNVSCTGRKESEQRQDDQADSRKEVRRERDQPVASTEVANMPTASPGRADIHDPVKCENREQSMSQLMLERRNPRGSLVAENNCPDHQVETHSAGKRHYRFRRFDDRGE